MSFKSSLLALNSAIRGLKIGASTETTSDGRCMFDARKDAFD